MFRGFICTCHLSSLYCIFPLIRPLVGSDTSTALA
nr:MAG TPA: hypothetical protein [Bacteriophage sp.]